MVLCLFLGGGGGPLELLLLTGDSGGDCVPAVELEAPLDLPCLEGMGGEGGDGEGYPGGGGEVCPGVGGPGCLTEEILGDEDGLWGGLVALLLT